MTEIFSQPDDAGPARASEAETSLWGRLGAQAADTLDPKDSLSAGLLLRRSREAAAGGDLEAVGSGGDLDVFSGQSLEDRQGVIDAKRAAIPDISQGDAKLLLKQDGLTEQDVHLGDQETHKLPVLKMQIDEAHTRRDRQAAIERGPQGFFPGALGLVTSLGVGMIDPINAAAFSIPVIGEARMGKILASAGDSILARGAVRFGQGAAQGAVGTAALQPADWWLHTRDGRDYTMAQAMESVIMGAGMGGAFHAIPGGVGDVLARRRGEPLAGSPQDLLLRGLMTGTHVHADQLAEEGVPVSEVPGIASVAAPAASEVLSGHPADALADLPPAAREDAVHAAMADIISGKPTQAAEMLNISADHDPRIAESLEAWHGSPHDFDRFDVGQIGTGEGAQSYGHGLYFAENEKVARGYKEALSRENPPLSAKALANPDLGPRIKEATADFDRLNDELADAANSHSEARILEVQRELAGAHRYLEAVHRETNEKYPPGALYKVRINADQEHFIDWDKRLDEQSPRVQEAIKHAMGIDYYGKFDAEKSQKLWNEHRYSEAGVAIRQGHIAFSDEQVARRLSEAGVPGIKYLDQGSRGVPTHNGRVQSRGDGKFDIVDDFGIQAGPFDTLAEATQHLDPRKNLTRNFVVFDDKHIEITHKNGEPVQKEELIKEHAVQQAKEKAAKTARGRAAADPKTWSLFEYLASRGGLKPDPEITTIFGNGRGPFVPGFGPLIRKGGMALDEALVAAKEGAYIHDVDQLHAPHVLVDAARRDQPLTVDINDMLRLFDENARGQKTYRADHVAETKYDPAHESHLVLAELEHELEASGAKVENIDPKLLDRTVKIVKRDGESDVLAAYERAIMEDAERYDATAHKRQSEAEAGHIPGWDAADAGAAPGDGKGGPGERGPAGRSDQRAGDTDGKESRGDGRGDRSSPAVAAADPRWRQLADATPDYNDPETLAESEAADHVPEPDSLVPERSLTALETAAADAEEVWRKLEPTLTEKERALVHDVMNQLKLDAETRVKIITDGAACLVGAVG